ncbi:hypothetical protein [Sandarakinorhabdus sp.]|uniref:hypothetical protein n=1 Tax=Sandarakinorhabdus sp. TaxID=1916663 RepID=UPI00333EF7A0
MAELPARLAARLRWLGRVLAVLSLLFGAAFVVLARRSAGSSDAATLASGLFWGAAVLQFALALLLLSRRRKG